MAGTVRLVRLTWQNGVRFKMDTKLDSGSYITILEMDENGDIGALWPHASQLCEKYFKQQMASIGEAMKAP
ncbi:hypothetical protein LCGC14_1905320 [marine sediment metagenome]|uniref:Uncharacterized protein n=1 Tax=marine sediment metagenome TaxID=412755 RepID=A0A0F9FVQ9_9ZZZZ